MERINQLESGTYVVAVSGGVDSVVLLDVLARQNSQFIVAHFDHGARPDSADDAQFVATLAKNYGLDYETERQELGAGVSEETARSARYGFLRRVRDTHKATAMVTAHHADDVIETMVINLIRGTGWRGLCSLKNTAELKRPFLAVSKDDIIAYAREHNLTWREDATNSDDHYLRNAVRHQLMPAIDRKAWLALYQNQIKLATLVDEEVGQLTGTRRYDYTMWPRSVALEVVKQLLGVTRAQADYALDAIKTAKHGAVVAVGNNQKLQFTRDNFVVMPLNS